MKTEVTSRELANLLGLASSEIADLSKRKILSSGSKKGTYRLQVSVRNYVEHLRKRPAEQESKHPGIKRKKATALVFDSEKSETESPRRCRRETLFPTTQPHKAAEQASAVLSTLYKRRSVLYDLGQITRQLLTLENYREPLT